VLVFAFAFPPLVMLILAGVFGTHATVGFFWQNPEHCYVAASAGVPVIALALIGLPVTLASYSERGVLRRGRPPRSRRSAGSLGARQSNRKRKITQAAPAGDQHLPLARHP
jgi:hypothetical protein